MSKDTSCYVDEFLLRKVQVAADLQWDADEGTSLSLIDIHLKSLSTSLECLRVLLHEWESFIVRGLTEALLKEWEAAYLEFADLEFEADIKLCNWKDLLELERVLAAEAQRRLKIEEEERVLEQLRLEASTLDSRPCDAGFVRPSLPKVPVFSLVSEAVVLSESSSLCGDRGGGAELLSFESPESGKFGANCLESGQSAGHVSEASFLPIHHSADEIGCFPESAVYAKNGEFSSFCESSPELILPSGNEFNCLDEVPSPSCVPESTVMLESSCSSSGDRGGRADPARVERSESEGSSAASCESGRSDGRPFEFESSSLLSLPSADESCFVPESECAFAADGESSSSGGVESESSSVAVFLSTDEFCCVPEIDALVENVESSSSVGVVRDSASFLAPSLVKETLCVPLSSDFAGDWLSSSHGAELGESCVWNLESSMSSGREADSSLVPVHPSTGGFCCFPKFNTLAGDGETSSSLEFELEFSPVRGAVVGDCTELPRSFFECRGVFLPLCDVSKS